MEEMSIELKKSFKSALQKMGLVERRAYAAELCDTYYGCSAHKMEREFGCSRQMIEKGQGEQRTGILCHDRLKDRGRKKKNTIILI